MNPDVRDIVASVAAHLKTAEANNAPFDYVIYKMSSGYDPMTYLEARELYVEQPNYAEINKSGTYQQRCSLAEAVVRSVN